MSNLNKHDAIRLLQNILDAPHAEIEDGWYSCPLHPDYYGPVEDDEKQCDCGKTDRDEIIQKVINYLLTN